MERRQPSPADCSRGPRRQSRGLWRGQVGSVVWRGTLATVNQALVGVAKNDPCGTLDANIRGTWLLLEAARQSQVKQVLVASSDKAYGDSDRLPYREDYPLQGRFPYEVSKSCADLITTMADEEIRPSAIGHTIVRREPVGVCAGIIPWNVPLFITATSVRTIASIHCPTPASCLKKRGSVMIDGWIPKVSKKTLSQ